MIKITARIFSKTCRKRNKWETLSLNIWTFSISVPFRQFVNTISCWELPVEREVPSHWTIVPVEYWWPLMTMGDISVRITTSLLLTLVLVTTCYSQQNRHQDFKGWVLSLFICFQRETAIPLLCWISLTFVFRIWIYFYICPLFVNFYVMIQRITSECNSYLTIVRNMYIELQPLICRRWITCADVLTFFAVEKLTFFCIPERCKHHFNSLSLLLTRNVYTICEGLSTSLY